MKKFNVKLLVALLGVVAVANMPQTYCVKPTDDDIKIVLKKYFEEGVVNSDYKKIVADVAKKIEANLGNDKLLEFKDTDKYGDKNPKTGTADIADEDALAILRYQGISSSGSGDKSWGQTWWAMMTVGGIIGAGGGVAIMYFMNSTGESNTEDE